MDDKSQNGMRGSLELNASKQTHALESVIIKDYAGNAWVGRAHGDNLVLNPQGETVCHTAHAPAAGRESADIIGGAVLMAIDIDETPTAQRDVARTYLKGGVALPLDVHPGDIPNLCKPSGHKR